MEPQNTRNTRKELIYKNESYLIRGAVFEVYREMGCGFLEAVYQECLEKEFQKQGIPYVSQPEIELFYKQEKLRQIYKPDLVCYGKIIIELKAVKEICDQHRAQLHNYLKAAKLELGFIVNFGHYPKATIERIVK
jgi:GxxExxY protein